VSSLTFGTVATHGRTDLEPGCGGAAGLLLVSRQRILICLHSLRLRLGLFVCAPCSTALRKGAKRGEPQIYLDCVTLWALAGGVVGPRAFAVPVPEAPTENKSAPPWPRRIGRGVGAILFPQRKRGSRKRGRKKAVTRPLTLAVELTVPRTEDWGRGEDLSPSPSVRQPSDCCPRKRHVWGTRQSRWFRGPAALLCVRAARRLLRPARIRIFSTHAPICSRIYLPASSRRQRELGATNFGLDQCRGRFAF